MSGRLSISLSALAANYRLLAQRARGEVGAVVKADAYGLGAAAVASRLKREGCRELFVATAAEGVALRHALADPVIYVLEGAYAETAADLVGANLMPVLNTPAQCAAWAPTGRPAAVHIDTGMQRLGFPAAEGIAGLGEVPFEISLFISHFARADEPGHATVTEQITRSSSFYKALKQQHPHMRLSLCNSAGLLEGLGPEDLGRAGIALYGGNPYDHAPNPMTPIVKLEARVMQIRSLPAGVPIGYGGSYVTTRPTRLAILGVGYADGVPRLLSNNGEVAWGDVRCPIVGRVSMDLLIVDATEADVNEGDWLQVIGPTVPLDDVAARAQTLAYEILTGISRRVPRIYVEESI